MRRNLLGSLLGISALAAAVRGQPPAPARSRVLIKSAWGSADPTQAAFPFHHARAFDEAGHPVQIFLLGEAVTLMRSAVAAAVVPVGWPPLSEALADVIHRRIPIHV